MKFYSTLYLIILKNLCMANMSFFYFFFIFVGWKRVFWHEPLMPRFFKKKKKPQVLNFFVTNIVLILLFSYAKRYFDKSLWKKMPFVIKLSPPGKPLIGPRPKNTFFAPHISVDYFVKKLSMYLYDFCRYVTFYKKWYFSWIAPYYHLKLTNSNGSQSRVRWIVLHSFIEFSK